MGDLNERFASFVKPLDANALSLELAGKVELNEQELKLYLASVLNEAQYMLGWLSRDPSCLNGRVLEVGAGTGVLFAFLRNQGYSVEAIEPLASGFDFSSEVRRLVTSCLDAPSPWPITAAELVAERYGTFDFIFSLNVLEHMQPLHPNLDGLARVLKPSGRMLHVCPNYRFPYEPHFRRPLLPGFPRLTPWMFDLVVRNNEVWKTLNFITARDMMGFAKRNGLACEFDGSIFREAVERLSTDPAFAERNRGLARFVIALFANMGLLPLIRKLPATWLSPMAVRFTKPSSASR